MTEARLSNEFIEVAITAPTSAARLSNEFIEVAITAPTSAARLSNEFIEVASAFSAQGAPGDLPWDGACGLQTALGYWVPRSPAVYHRPVQCEDATLGLTGAELTDGRGILMWPVGDQVHFAIVSSPAEILMDDIVPLGDVQVALTIPATGGGYVPRASVFRLGGDLFFSVMWKSAGDAELTPKGMVQIYKANSASNPTAWAHWGDVQDYFFASAPDFVFGNPYVAGIPYLLSNGRWIYLGSLWQQAFSLHFQRAGVWISDNGGRSWTNVVDKGYYLVGASYLHFMSEQMACDPSTGYLYWQGHSTAAGSFQADIFRSMDGGVTWTEHDNSSGPLFSAFVNNGTDLFAMDVGGSIRKLVGDGTVVANWTDTGETWIPAGGFTGVNRTREVRTNKGIIIGGAVYYFWADRVAMAAARWLVGRVGI